MAIKECVICGLQFDARSRVKTCSSTCNDKNRRSRRAKAERDRRAANPEKFREWKRLYRASNLEKIRSRDRNRRAANPEKYRQQKRASYAADPERFKAYEAKYRHADPEKYRQQKRASYAADPEKYREKERERRNLRSAAASMLEACATMILLNERGIHDETE